MSNIFDALSDLEDDMVPTPTSSRPTTPALGSAVKRPLPIYVFYTNYTEFKKSITNTNGVTGDTTLKFKLNNLMFRSANLDQYFKIAEYLKNSKIQYYSYNPTPVKPRKAIIKYLFNDPDNDEILTDFVNKRIPAIKVSNLITRNKEKIYIFIVAMSKSYIEKLYNVKNILGFTIKIEALKPKNSITQCHHCQRLGHASLH